ncbi:stage V sporulation protein AB [Keratinibaculum paraultunense]|uniref:Stage V sporulation protein AB n=1 Tax=Keratinibaculum paraultunense TaxID=1278232 RepID=A0A4R3KYW4_9FIRM|nr:stage V sporulation protein AB [Keratinibaculum paraultunense]QQY80504.1 stage V sporulation protein AB [Keratinibaculum paraultunense]TCS91226.1 stage V sporulation protein AB [Keratinibaculum paraultunense]
MIKSIFLVLIGISAGTTVGTAIAAFITLLQFVPRLAQITETNDYIKVYEYTLIVSGIIFSFICFSTFNFSLNKFFSVFVGIGMGIFLGLFSSALAEVLNVIPVLVKKIKLKHELKYIIEALIFGKVAGSLLYWLVFTKY